MSGPAKQLAGRSIAGYPAMPRTLRIRPTSTMEINYPRNQIDFEESFSTEEKCLAFVSAIKWPRGFVCPKCQGGRERTKSRHRLVCRDCGHETSVLCGTVFTGAHKPLRTWIHALWWITGQKNGICLPVQPARLEEPGPAVRDFIDFVRPAKRAHLPEHYQQNHAGACELTGEKQ
jgi:hypothetical protein